MRYVERFRDQIVGEFGEDVWAAVLAGRVLDTLEPELARRVMETVGRLTRGHRDDGHAPTVR